MIDQSTRPTPMACRIILGLFILWQLFFLFSSNLLGFLPKARESPASQPIIQTLAPDWSESKGTVANWERSLSTITARWSELTGQPQNWALFAPNVTNTVPFVAVEFCWEDDPSSVRSIARLLAPLAAGGALDELSLDALAWKKDLFDWPAFQNQLHNLVTNREGSSPRSLSSVPPEAGWRRHQSFLILFSENEPRDRQDYMKFGHFRLRRYESCIDISPASGDKEPDNVVDVWREDIESKVRDRWRLMHAYMSWQLGRLLKDHPELPEPRQVILWARVFRVPSPGEMPSPWIWQGPEWHPIARWQPGAEWSADLLPVEMSNPVVNRFESLRQRGEPRHE